MNAFGPPASLPPVTLPASASTATVFTRAPLDRGDSPLAAVVLVEIEAKGPT